LSLFLQCRVPALTLYAVACKRVFFIDSSTMIRSIAIECHVPALTLYAVACECEFLTDSSAMIRSIAPLLRLNAFAEPATYLCM
jgi:hypothetical protein